MTTYQCILPRRLFEKILEKRDALSFFVKYQRSVRKSSFCYDRIKFLSTSLKNDIIPKLLRFKVPANGCFESTVVHNFQKRLLRKEIQKAMQTKICLADALDISRRTFTSAVPRYYLPSAAFHVRYDMRVSYQEVSDRHRKKLDDLAGLQEKPLHNVGKTVHVGDNVDVPQFVIDYLSFGPKHPVLDKFNEMHFLADADKLLYYLKSESANSDVLNEVNALSFWYTKEMKKQREDPTLNRVNKLLRKMCVKAVPFDKGQGFCLMRSDDYDSKLKQLLACQQFEKVTASSSKNPVYKTESALNCILKKMKDNGDLPDELYQKFRVYGLAKVHEEGIPLRAVLSLPGSCYDNLNKGLAGLFCHIPSENIETSTAKTMAILRETHIEDEEEIFSLDVKSLYTNVPVQEAIDLACDTLFTGDKTPQISRTTYHKLMELSNTNVWFMSREKV